jgi:hypothetical protein
MRTAELLQYVPRNLCRGVLLPTVERAEDDAMFLTHAEVGLLIDGMHAPLPPTLLDIPGAGQPGRPAPEETGRPVTGGKTRCSCPCAGT